MPKSSRRHKPPRVALRAQTNGFQLTPKPRKSARLKAKDQQPGGSIPILVYSSLPTPTSIRLLTLLPGPVDSHLTCTVTITDLSESPVYEALSYEWKSQTQLFSLVCNGDSKVLVGRNLRDALLRLRRRDEERVLWIDAICIDQEDANEKTRQVELMKRIYESAEGVVAWLGREEERMVVGMRAICEIQRYYLRARDGEVGRGARRCCCERGNEEEVNGDEPERKVWEEALMLDECSYFSRVWTVQELVVARRATFICGNFSMSLKCLDGFYTVVHDLWDKTPNDGFLRDILDRNIMSIPAIRHDMRESLNVNGLLNLGVILRETRDLMASDPRDKVFAVLNLACDQTGSIAYVDHGGPIALLDYNLNLKSVYTSIARDLLKGDMCWDVFEQISIPTNRWRPPSWVPDLRDRSRRRVRIPGRRDFNAAGKIEPCLPNSADLPFNQLRLRGVLVSRISAIKQEALDGDSYSEGMELDLTRSFQVAKTIAFESGKYQHTGQPIKEAFLQTRLAHTWSRGGELVRAEVSDFDDNLTRTEIVEPGTFKCNGSFAKEIAWRSMVYDFFITEDGMMGLCPVTALPGDVLYIIMGCRMPLVLRADRDRRDQQVFKLVGTCYIHGYMDGEWITKLAEEAQKTKQDWEGCGLDEFFEWWTKAAQITERTEEIVLI